MDSVLAGPSLLAAVLGAALLGFLSAYLLARSTQRRRIRRLIERLAELSRHPLIGELAPDGDADIGRATEGIAALLAALRLEVQRAQGRAAPLQALADGPTDVALISLDAEWLVTAFSRGAAGLTGWAADEVVGQHVEALFAPGEWEQLLPKLARRTVREEGFSATSRFLRRDGGTLACRLSVGPMGRPGPGAAGTLLVARDLTQEQEVERRLRLSEERHRRLVEEMRDGVLVVQAGKVVFANPALASLVGSDPDSLRGTSFKDLLDTRDLLSVLDLVARVEREGEGPGEMVCRLTARGRGTLEVRLSWAPTEYQGAPAVFCTVSDLTERARSERSVIESEARLRAALSAAGDGMLICGESGQGLVVTLLNPAFAALFGLAPEALLGAPLQETRRLLADRGLRTEEFDTLIEAARTGAGARRDALEIQTPRRTVLDLHAAPIAAAGHGLVGVIVSARDVTARVDQERGLAQGLTDATSARRDLEKSLRELAEVRETLTERNAQLERFNNELRTLDEMKSNLLANVSHELHTPLVSIKGYTEMILKRKLGPLTPEQERGLAVALKNIDRLIELIDNLLSFARLETGETQLTLEDVPLYQLVDEAVELVGERINRRGLSVTTQYESDDLLVRGDRVKLGQVFTNLLTNAVKFNREGGRIALAARRAGGGFVEVEVQDSGIGIPPEEQEKIFERFYQVEAGPRRRYEGTGIGLSIVRDILRLHGCSIAVRSTPGEGTTFVFTLPIGRRGTPADSPSQTGRTRARE